MKTTTDTYTGRPFRYNSICYYTLTDGSQWAIPQRMTARTAKWLHPGRTPDKLLAELNDGATWHGERRTFKQDMAALDRNTPHTGARKMTKQMAIPYVAYVLDDTLTVLPLGMMKTDARLVGWQCGFEPLFVSVHSYLPGIRLDDDEAEEIARDYLAEIHWFSGEPTAADYIL